MDTPLALLGAVITLVTVPVVALLVWLFKFVFEKTLPAQQVAHAAALDKAQDVWGSQMKQERDVFATSIAGLREDFKSEMTKLREDFHSSNVSIVGQLQQVNETLRVHQNQIEELLSHTFPQTHKPLPAKNPEKKP